MDLIFRKYSCRVRSEMPLTPHRGLQVLGHIGIASIGGTVELLLTLFSKYVHLFVLVGSVGKEIAVCSGL